MLRKVITRGLTILLSLQRYQYWVLILEINAVGQSVEQKLSTLNCYYNKLTMLETTMLSFFKPIHD